MKRTVVYFDSFSEKINNTLGLTFEAILPVLVLIVEVISMYLKCVLSTRNHVKIVQKVIRV